MKQLLTKHKFPAAAALVVMVILAVTAPHILRIMVALPLVLLLPGFALTIILFKPGSLGIAERLLLSVGLSVALTALIGLALNWTPWGLTPASVAIASLVVLVIESAVILLTHRASMGLTGLSINPVFTLRQWILVSLAALVTITAIFVARSPVDQHGFEGYTILWVQASDTPDMIRLGVRCEEFETTRYQIRFEVNDTLHEGPSLELDPGESWEGLLEVPADEYAGEPLTVYLYRTENPTEVYRHAVWWPE